MADTQQNHQYDLVIAGGAMAGATLALALEKLTAGNIRVAVVEAAVPDDSHPGYDARSIALAYGSCQLLDELGLWQQLSPSATAIKAIKVSDSGHFGHTAFSADSEGLPFLGNVIELADAGRVFHQALNASDAVTLLCPTKVSNITRHVDSVDVELDNGTTLNTKLIVAADGAVSACCEMLGLDRSEFDYHQVAVIANVSTERPHQGQAFERFTRSGPVAMLPMSEGRSSLAWCVPPEKVNDIMALPDSDFLEHLQQAFGWRLGRLTQTGKRVAYPLLLRQANQLVSHRFAVVGNAAQTLHPIAGQGFNLGLRDVATLAEEIAAHLANGAKDSGDMSLLQRYRTRREKDRNKTVMMTSALVSGFSNDSSILALGRNLGLNAMTALPPLKAPLLKQAMGLVNR